jgi:alkaline phosphatase
MELSHGRYGIWLETAKRPDVVKGTMDTRSLDSLVTDSAAASTAWGTGSLVLNGAISTLPGIELTPIYDVMGRAGMLRGLVTTATATHATPSGFASSVTSSFRRMSGRTSLIFTVCLLSRAMRLRRRNPR